MWVKLEAYDNGQWVTTDRYYRTENRSRALRYGLNAAYKLWPNANHYSAEIQEK